MSETSGRDAATGSPPGPAPSGYAIAGQTPAAVLRPSGVAEVQAALREASASARAVIVQGGRTAIETGNPPDRYDVALDLTALDAVVAHEPDDFTATVEAGMRFDALRALLAQHGQFLPLDPPHSRTATVGGVVARGRGGLAAGGLRGGAGLVDRLLGGPRRRPPGARRRAGGQERQRLRHAQAVRGLLGDARGHRRSDVQASSPAGARRNTPDRDAGLQRRAAAWRADRPASRGVAGGAGAGRHHGGGGGPAGAAGAAGAGGRDGGGRPRRPGGGDRRRGRSGVRAGGVGRRIVAAAGGCRGGPRGRFGGAANRLPADGVGGGGGNGRIEVPGGVLSGSGRRRPPVAAGRRTHSGGGAIAPRGRVGAGWRC